MIKTLQIFITFYYEKNIIENKIIIEFQLKFCFFKFRIL